MHDLEFLVIRNKNKRVFAEMEFSNPNDCPYVYKACTSAINEQTKSLTGLSVGLSFIEYEEIPAKTNSSILCILDENSLVPSDYINRILAMNNLHTSSGFFCGPIFTECSAIKTNWFVSRISNLYKRYTLNEFGSFISCKLNDDIRNYPPVSGNVFIGSYYNRVGGYNPVTSPRGPIYRNVKFFDRLNKSNVDIIYSTRLSTGYFITQEEMNIENFSSYYYAIGYSDGMSAELSQIDDQYIKCQNMIEISDPSWISSGTQSDNEIYKKYVAILKCNYELGFFEAVTKTKIV
jgi:hypothetical protein